MAANGEKRDPRTHRTPSQKKAHYREYGKAYQDRPEQVDNRMERNQARAMLAKEGKVRKGDGKDVDHKTPLIKGGNNDRGNLRVSSRRANRGHKMG